MFKKAHDHMFRKAQMRLFSMIVSILLAVFIALIGSINVITKAVMRGQSKEVLMKIAAGTEYDDVNSKFTFTPPDDGANKEVRHSENPPPKHTETTAEASHTTQKPTSAAETSTSEKATETDTHAAPTEAEHNDPTEAPENNDPPEEQYDEEPYDEPPVAADPQPAVTPPPEINTDPATQAPDNSGGGQNNQGGDQGYWNGQWGDPSQWNQNGQWGDPNQWNQNGTWNGYNPWAWNPWMWWNTWAHSPGAYSNEKEPDDFDHESYRAEHGGAARDDRADNGNADADQDGIKQQSFIGEGRLMTLSYSGESVLDGFTVLSNRSDPSEQKTVSKGNGSKPKEYKSSALSNNVKEEPIPRTLGSIDFFVIMADKNGKYLATLNNDDLGEEKAQNYITAIINEDLDTGMLNSYQFYQTDKSNGKIMVFTDKSYEMDMLRQLKRTTIIIGSIALVILSVLAYFLSKKSIQPIKTAFNKQKQFVSDASHELKTPLTVISTNVDVLEGEIGHNRWLTYIKSQTERMSVLVNDLLNLTRLENNTAELERKYFNLSKAIVNTALPFECQAFESNKTFEVDVDENIMLCASEKLVKQMAAIFIDNALKYSNDGGTVRVSLQKLGDKKVLSIYNTGEGIKEEDTEKIFERFYRSDESRNRATGGYGLGLAIAKSIIDKHKFKLNIMNIPGKSVCFMISM
ncbi:MAG: hypothetical protein K6G33_02995 [Ruminococcus sp.]|uniref:ATP-binding protein n=1 Tax=Ruminococcus sp. TaxID=41978 RepID=UPI0025F44C3D|nr:ATP-binding protein [Ruminococcus sp.]MCR5599697.1 hypothetical protein [Ruminococcus sp.]